jgi:UDP-N-acetylmuramoylalanine-D-glutamate ligase
MEMSLFIEACPARTVGITGSNGKTTTTALCYEMLCEVMPRGQPELAGRWADAAKPRKPGAEPEMGRVWLGGNIGTPLLNRLAEITVDDVVVLELSSFQLMDWHRIRKSADVALITNITPNHLDWHKSMDEYIHAKCAVFAYQPRERRCAAMNLDDQRCANLLELHPALKSARKDGWRGPMFPHRPDRAPAAPAGPKVLGIAMAMGQDETENPQDSIIGYTVDPARRQESRVSPQLTRFCFGGGVFDTSDGRPIEADPGILTEWRRGFAFVGALNRADLKLPGLFNWSNAVGAYAAASAALSWARPMPISGALRRFKGVEHRLEFCGEVNGARCFNDSIATDPTATMAALSVFDSGVHLILGGASDKGAGYEKLAAAIAVHSGIRAIYMQGPTAEAMSRAGFEGKRFDTFEAACKAAFAAAGKGDVVLMSPASTSFYEYAPGRKFANFDERGMVFKRLVAAAKG